MQSWTDWFREQQEAYGTIDDFVRASGIKQRMVGNYRAGTIPRRQASIDKIVAIFGEAGPLPTVARSRKASVTAQITALEERVAALEDAVAELAAIVSTRRRGGGVPATREAARAELQAVDAIARRVLARAAREGDGDDEQQRQSAG